MGGMSPCGSDAPMRANVATAAWGGDEARLLIKLDPLPELSKCAPARPSHSICKTPAVPPYWEATAGTNREWLSSESG